MSRVYCSDAARLRAEDNAATAARVDVWILVELPVTWGRNPIDDAQIPSPVVKALKRATRAIPHSRIVFIRKRVECLGPTTVYVARSGLVPGITRIDCASFDEVASIAFADVAQNIAPSATPLVLVCTHGQHDSCCGRRGYPLYDALHRREELDVWQCSHIGGDRFAANALILPWGLYYGPVETRDAGELVESIARGEIFLSGYRGRSTEPRIVQAAETFVRRATNILERDALQCASREAIDEHHTRVILHDVRGGEHEVVVEQFVAFHDVLLTCSAKNASPLPQYRLASYTFNAERSSLPAVTGGHQ